MLLATVAAAAVLASAATSSAQTAPPAQAAAAPAAAPVSIGDVVVTAQKREQRLQDVPVVVTVLNAQQLESAQVKSVNDLTVLTPGLSVNTNQGEATTTIRIRGVGNVADNPGLEQSVGLYIDGVYRPRNGVSFNDLGELSDVEILKGPQGTLFGKNTIAGVVQITTQRPSFNYSAIGEVTAQNYGGIGGSVSVTGPLIGDVLAGRIYIAARDRDGYASVQQPAGSGIPKLDDEHMWTARGQLLWTPVNNFDFNFISDYSKRDDHCCAAADYLNGAGLGATPGPAVIVNSVLPGSVPNPVGSQNDVVYNNRKDIEHIIDYGFSGNASWTTPWFNGAKLTSITAYRNDKDAQGGDADYTSADILYTTPDKNYEEFKQFSEELLYRGSTSKIDWQVGAFYSHEILDNGLDDQYGAQLGEYVAALSPLPAAGFPAGDGAIEKFHQVENGEAIYTQDSYKITDNLTFIGGLRYTWEHKTLRSAFSDNDANPICAALFGGAPFTDYLYLPKSLYGTPCLINPAFKGLTTDQKLSEEALTGTAKLQYKFNSSDMIYISYSRGNLVGGFNLAEVTLPCVDPVPGTDNCAGTAGAPNSSLAPQKDTHFPGEDVNAYELGAKTAWFDRRLVIDGAIFYQKYYNHQLNAFTGTQFVESTIPEAVAEGAEFDSAFAVTHDLRVNLGVTYADTYYPDSAINRKALESGNLFLLPGERLSYAPLWSLAAGGSYQHEVYDGFKGFATVDVKYNSDYQVGSDEDPVKNQPSYTVVDATVGVSSPDDKIKLTLWATNLFNQFYKQAAFDGVIQTLSTPQPASHSSLNNYYYFPSPPRFFGVTLKVKY
jgi:outer membrane receptor protein involved in Fe transport